MGALLAARSMFLGGLLLIGLSLVLDELAHAAKVTVKGRVILVDGKPFFPIMQWLQSKGRIAEEKALGINAFAGNGGSDTDADYLAECAKQGVFGVVAPNLALKSHPALLGWIFGDEPDLESNKVEPSTLLAEYQTLKQGDPDHPTFLTVTAGFFSLLTPPAWMAGKRDRYFEYAKATDIIGFDYYPIYGYCKPDLISRQGTATGELAGTYAPGRPVYSWIEAAAESGQWCELCARCNPPISPCDKDHRCPNDGVLPEEVRNEVWQSIVAGATAIGYFTHAWECPSYTQLCLSTGLTAELKRTNAQITALAPVLLEGTPASGLSVSGGQLASTSRVLGGTTHLVVVNLERKAVTVQVSGAPAASAEVYEESHTVPVSGGSFSDSLPSLGVRIYLFRGSAGDGAPAGSEGGAGAGERGVSADRGGAADAGTRPAGDGCGCAAAGGAGSSLWVSAALVALLARRRRRSS